MPSPLENLCGPTKPLAAEPPDAREFAGLMRSGLARLADAQVMQLSVEGRFDLAYNAAHAMCLAALRWHGYRSSNRFIVFQVLPHTFARSGGVARAGQRPRDTKPRRVRRRSECG
ncbi:hypothetical protein [Variovorax sp. GB1R11]|uniref:hypothetical protein n=1 Tax=Variovorax sp. GB1R11 TaxID=3443741 RepID=UPI003F499ACF